MSVPRCRKGGGVRTITLMRWIEFLAEPALLDQGREVLAGGHDEPDLAARRGIPGGRPVVAELQVAEQVELQRHRQVGDVVDEERAAAGEVELRGPEQGGIGGRRRGACSGRSASSGDNSSASAAASQSTNGRSVPNPIAWISRASCDLPVPGSPAIRTGDRAAAIVAARSTTCRQRRVVADEPEVAHQQVEPGGSGPAPASGRARPGRRPPDPPRPRRSASPHGPMPPATPRRGTAWPPPSRPPASASAPAPWRSPARRARPAVAIGAAEEIAVGVGPDVGVVGGPEGGTSLVRASQRSSACSTAARSSAAGTGYFNTAIAPSRKASLARSGCNRGNSSTTGTSRCLRRTYVSNSSASPSPGSTPARTRSMLIPLHQADGHPIVGRLFDDIAQ